jgi:uncharacterized protein (DUF486 family)
MGVRSNKLNHCLNINTQLLINSNIFLILIDHSHLQHTLERLILTMCFIYSIIDIAYNVI